MKNSLTLTAIIIFCLVLINCSNTHGPVSRTQILLGTFFTITDYDSTLQESIIESAFDSAFQAISEIERMTNPYDSQSAIGRINQFSHEQIGFSIKPQLYSILSPAMEISKKTNGSFDFTLWPVFKLWNFGTDSAGIPSNSKIEQALERVNFNYVQLYSDSLAFKIPGVEIDLGGIVKGYAVEIAREILIRKGLRDFIIDAGGNLGIEWHKRVPVDVQVRHPRKDGAFWCKFPIDSSVGIATSGDYQYYFIEKNRRYHHILKPQTGFPAEPMVSTTIIAPDAIQADGYSTAVFVMGPVKGAEFIKSHPKLEGLMIFPLQNRKHADDNFETYVSSGLEDSFIPLSNEE